MKKIIVLLTVLIGFVLVGFAVSQEDSTSSQSVETSNSSKSMIAVGGNIGVQKIYCDLQHLKPGSTSEMVVTHTGLGPAFEAMVKLLVSDRFHLSASLGYGQLNDGFSNNSFVTSLITGDLKANINLLKPGKWNPYVTLGLGLFSFSYDSTSINAHPDQGYVGKSYFDGALIFGGGVEYMVTPKIAINAFADYRQCTGDFLDGEKRGNSNDGYLNARAGINYYLGGRKLPASAPTKEDLLASTENSESDALLNEKDNNVNMFAAKLDKMDSEENELTMENYVRLKSRIDELSSLIDNKEKELEELKATLDFKDQRIADLRTELDRASSSPRYNSPSSSSASGDFSTGYENALRDYYARDYHRAIDEFKSLVNNFSDHKLASNCQYWIGECYFGMNDFTQAADAFQRVFDFSFSYKKDDATLMLGRCYMKLNDNTRAKSFFQGLINDYPDSEYIEKAKDWLEKC
jgi:tol-pal system protein YbgF